MNRTLTLRLLRLFCITLGIQFWFAASLQLAKASQKPQNTSEAEPASKANAPFAHGSVIHARTADGTDLAFVTSYTPSGERIGFGSARFPSPERALNELRRRAKRASKIISDEPYKDASGKSVGQRVVAQFAKTDQTPEHHAVIWTKDSNWYMVTARTLETALAQEKEFIIEEEKQREDRLPK